MTWESQTRDEIKFISPELNVFTAKWIANERSVEKKLGIFETPNLKGSVIQDLSVKSAVYPLTIYFDGSFHYSDANKFYKAFGDEPGQWEVTHPTKGAITLQPSSLREIIDPVNSGNVTVFETNWLEPANIDVFISTPELGALTLLSVIETIQNAIVSAQQLRADLYSSVQAALNVVNQVRGFADSFMAEIAALDVLINDSWNEAKATFGLATTAYQNNPSDPDVVANLTESIIDIITIPLESNSDYTTRNTVYTNFTESILTLAPTTENPTQDDFNKSVFVEISALASLMGICRIIVTSEFKTRAEVISAMDNLTTVFNDTINALESIQERFE